MNVFIPAGPTSQETFISELGELIGSSEDLSLYKLPVEELLYSVKSYCYSGQYPLHGANSTAHVVIVLGSGDVDACEAIMGYMSSSQAVMAPRIVFLSSVLTWAGKSFHQFDEVTDGETQQQGEIGDSLEKLFRKREPLPGSHDLYSFENKLMTVAAAATADVTVIGLGLIYGGKGHDMEGVFKQIWNYGIGSESAKVKLQSMLGGDNKVPMMHYKDLAKLIMKGIGSDLNGQKFLPASDCSNLTLNSTIEAVLSHVDGSPVTAADGIEYSSQEEVLLSVVDEASSLPKSLIWSTDLSFSSSVVLSRVGSGIPGVGGGGLLNSIGSVWDEFVSGHQLVPVSIFVTGNPQSGKTTVAKSIEETFQCLYVDIPAAVAFALRNPTVSSGQDSAGSALKGEIMAIVEAKAAEGKKPPKKGEEPEEVAIDPATVVVDDTLLQALSAETKRKCLAYVIKTDKKALRRGFVMDIWQTELVSSYEQLKEVMTALSTTSLPNVEGEGEGGAPDEAPVTTEETANAEIPVPTASTQPVSAPLPVFPEMILELQCSDQVLMSRLHEKEGIVDGDMKKASKEAQAAIKAFEPVLAGYTAQLESIPIPEPEPSHEVDLAAPGPEGEASAEGKQGDGEEEAGPVEPEFTMSHKAILEMVASEECTSFVFRIKTDAISVEEAALKAGQELAAVHGTVGWLTPEQQAALSKPQDKESSEANAGEVAAQALNDGAPLATAAANMASNVSSNEDQAEQVALREEMTKIVGGAKEHVREGLVEKATELQNYLLANVMTELSACMVEIIRTRPEDPILYLADRLEAIGAERERVAEEKARKKFDQLLLVAEGGELPNAEASEEVIGAASAEEKE